MHHLSQYYNNLSLIFLKLGINKVLKLTSLVLQFQLNYSQALVFLWAQPYLDQELTLKIHNLFIKLIKI